MMKTFLQLVADALLERYGNDLSRVTVVFPGKRASLFLDEALAEASPTPVWAPSYKTISELFEQASDYTLCDTVEAVCRLYKAYARNTDSPQTLDQFYGWGEILLSDFDDIDKHLVDVKSLFRNITDLRRLEDASYISPEQEKALRLFFKDFSVEGNTELKERFLALWDKMPAIYDDFNSSLRDAGLLYEGALQREVVNRKDGYPLTDTTYAFVGFNVLNDVEQSLFDQLQRRGQTLFFWDYDTFYCFASVHHEASYFLRKNLERYGNELPPSCFNNFTTPKQIAIIKASSENSQARYIPQWLEANRTPRENETAVVLCNEQLLQPVLHSLPDPDMPVNITMGFPFTSTPVYSFLLALTSMQTEGYDASSQRFRFEHLRALTAHPYARYVEENVWNRKVEGGEEMLNYLLEVIIQLAPHCADDLIAQEAVYICYTRLNRLMNLASGEDPLLQVNDVTLMRLVRNVLQSATIPFHGEPAVGLQVMGVLETRALDFRHLLMLSVGEGYLPKKASENTFIPYFLREAFGLTTIRHQIAVYAYYFYRLVQRAERITFVYNDSNAGVRQNEISRFLRQLMAETNMPIEQYALRTAGGVEPIVAIEKEKTTEIVEKLKSLFDNSGRARKDRRFLSPSAINCYTTCALKFYYRYIEDLRVEANPQDGLDGALFGQVFHRAAELLYRQLTSAGDVVRGQDIEPFMEMDGQRLEPFVRQAFREIFFQDRAEEYRGILYIANRVITTYLVQLLRHDRRMTPFRVLGLEVREVKTLNVGNMEIDTGGIIDRLDLVADDNVSGKQAIRVVDYKTGGRPETVSGLEKLFFETDQKAHYYFQTILYASIVAEHRGMAVTPCLFFVHKSGSDDYSPKLKIGGQTIHDVRQPLSDEDGSQPLNKNFMEQLETLVDEIFNPSVPFCQTQDWSACELCEFRQLCGR